MKAIKPRVPFCWVCGKKFAELPEYIDDDNKFIEIVIEGHPRVVHFRCLSGYVETSDGNIIRKESADCYFVGAEKKCVDIDGDDDLY